MIKSKLDKLGKTFGIPNFLWLLTYVCVFGAAGIGSLISHDLKGFIIGIVVGFGLAITSAVMLAGTLL